jgi:hypothetical protein
LLRIGHLGLSGALGLECLQIAEPVRVEQASHGARGSRHTMWPHVAAVSADTGPSQPVMPGH